MAVSILAGAGPGAQGAGSSCPEGHAVRSAWTRTVPGPWQSQEPQKLQCLGNRVSDRHHIYAPLGSHFINENVSFLIGRKKQKLAKERAGLSKVRRRLVLA